MGDILTASVYVGTAGSRNRKLTFRLMRSDGSSPGIVKLAMDSEAVPFIQNEYASLGFVNGLNLKEILVPQKYNTGVWQENKLIYQDNVFSGCYNTGNKLCNKIVSASAELALRTLETESTASKLNEIKAGIKALIKDGLLQSDFERFINSLEEKNIPLVFIHGDFVPYNIKLNDAGLILIDWEFARKGFPLSDLFHFIIQGGYQVKSLPAEKLLKLILHNKNNKEYFDTYLSALNLSPDLLIPLLKLYLLDALVFDSNINPAKKLSDNHFYLLLKKLFENE